MRVFLGAGSTFRVPRSPFNFEPWISVLILKHPLSVQMIFLSIRHATWVEKSHPPKSINWRRKCPPIEWLLHRANLVTFLNWRTKQVFPHWSRVWIGWPRPGNPESEVQSQRIEKSVKNLAYSIDGKICILMAATDACLTLHFGCDRRLCSTGMCAGDNQMI